MGQPEPIFFDYPVTYRDFFLKNNLFNEEYKDCSFVLTGEGGETVSLYILKRHDDYILYKTTSLKNPYGVFDDVGHEIIKAKNKEIIQGRDGNTLERMVYSDDIIVGLKIIKPSKFIEFDNADGNGYIEKGWEKTYSRKTTGGRKASVKKEIYGVMRCIYKIPGSRKEHIKYKGRLITVADYKKLMKNKA
jgi:hypothetical protein